MDLVVLGLKSLTREKIRSLLTIIGIIIGVATVFTLVSISRGTDEYVRYQFEKFGSNKIIVMPGGMQTSMATAFTGKPFTERELKALGRIKGVELVAGVGERSLTVEYKGEKIITMVVGVSIKQFKRLFEDVQGYELEEGRYPREGKREAVVGSLVAKNMFSKEIRAGSKIKINGVDFRVVGVMKEVGNRFDDTAVMIPYDIFEELTGEEKKYHMIFIKVVDGENIDELTDKIKRRLKNLRGAEDFTVLTTKQLMSKISAILGVLSLVLLIIAVISLIVGAIGVMNTMYMAVTERTKEIGILKAIGATKHQILLLFLTEAAALSLVGGIIGVSLGAIVAMGVESIARASGANVFRAYFGLDLFLGSLIFSAIIGLLSGFLPAKRAADLDPVEALRYE